jgi:hypothetical protein
MPLSTGFDRLLPLREAECGPILAGSKLQRQTPEGKAPDPVGKPFLFPRDAL